MLPRSLVYLLGLLPALAAGAVEVPAGTVIDVRQHASLGTRSSHPGDKIGATLITPVIQDGRTTIAAGATLEGEVVKVVRLGFGFKHQTAHLELRFHTLRPSGGAAVPIETRVVGISAAKETVDVDGRIHGIRATTNVSSSLAVAAWRLAFIAPGVGAPVWATKILFAPAPDTEINFPEGTEYRLKFTSPAIIAQAASDPPARVLVPAAAARAMTLLQALPAQRTNKKSGAPSDLINILVTGSADQVRRAFAAAGWSESVPQSTGSFVRTYYSIVRRSGYPNAPMGTMKFDGTRPGLEFQKNLNSFARRHHVRLWKRTGQMDGQDVWVAAASEDIGIAFRRQAGNFTHVIDANVDHERTKVVNDLLYTGCVESAGLLDREFLPASLDNGSGVRLRTDGRVAAVRLDACAAPRAMAATDIPPVTRPGAVKQFLFAVRNELVRSNAATLGVGATRLTTAGKSFLLGKPVNGAPAAAMYEQQSAWLRPGPLDAHLPAILASGDDPVITDNLVDIASALLPYR